MWEENEDDDDHRLRTFAIITTAPNALVAQLQNRMPAMLTRETEQAWLDTTTAPVHAVSLVVPYPTTLMGR
jgi:putative SOS response-associated peptidase YedK